MSTPMTPDRAYNALGLDEHTPRKEIRKAYFRLALKHHPDKAKDEQAKKKANEKFRDIKSAYEILTQDRDGEVQPSLDSLKRKQAQPSHAWTEYVGRSKKKTDYAAYGEENEDEETDDVRYGEESEDYDEFDGDDSDRQNRSDSDDSEEAVWPTLAMRTTGYIDPRFVEKSAIPEKASRKLKLGDGVKDIASTVKKEEWDDFRTTAGNTPFVFNPLPLRNNTSGNGAALTSKKAIRLNKPPTKSTEYGAVPTSRITSRGLPRVISMTKSGQPIHEGEDPDRVKPRGNYLTAAQYNQMTRPQTTNLTIADKVAPSEGSMKEIKVIGCQKCFPGVGHWTVEERDLSGKDPVCGKCKRKLERVIVEEMEEDVTRGDVSGLLLNEDEEMEEDVTEGEVPEIAYEDALAALAGEGGRSRITEGPA